MTEFKRTDTRPFDPRCACGDDGVFGTGSNLRMGQDGTWWCAACVPADYFAGRPGFDYEARRPALRPQRRPNTVITEAEDTPEDRARTVADAMQSLRR